MAYGTLYKVVNKQETLVDYSPEENRVAACFIHYITNRPFNTHKKFESPEREYAPFGEQIISVFIFHTKSSGIPSHHYSTNKFSKEQLLEFLKELNKVFPISWVENDKYYTVNIDEKEYINKIHVRTLLDFIRTAWESGPDKSLIGYFKVPKDIRLKYGVFLLLQLFSIKVNNLSSHSLPSLQSMATKFRILTIEEIKKRIEKQKDEGEVTSSNTFTYGTYTLWKSLASEKFDRYRINNSGKKENFSSEELNELEDLVLESEEAIEKALRIINPI